MLSAMGSCIFNRLCSIFIIVCFEFYFLVLHFIRITFFMNIFLFLGRVPLAGRIFDDLENTTS